MKKTPMKKIIFFWANYLIVLIWVGGFNLFIGLFNSLQKNKINTRFFSYIFLDWLLSTWIEEQNANLSDKKWIECVSQFD